jgi:hypothetical protein
MRNNSQSWKISENYHVRQLTKSLGDLFPCNGVYWTAVSRGNEGIYGGNPTLIFRVNRINSGYSVEPVFIPNGMTLEQMGPAAHAIFTKLSRF